VRRCRGRADDSRRIERERHLRDAALYATPALVTFDARVWIAAAVSGLTACTIGPVGSDAGVVDAGPQTVSDQCNTIASAFCMRAIACGAAYSLSQCIADEVPTCCTGSGCNAISGTSASAVDACKVAIASEDCNSVVTVGEPAIAACQGIPQH
jgi:hypothetical protein